MPENTLYDDAVRRLKACGIEVITHVILGLPGESRRDMLDTVSYVGRSHADGIKLQLLHVIRFPNLLLAPFNLLRDAHRAVTCKFSRARPGTENASARVYGSIPGFIMADM
mgnify:CR=1 FL=1